MYTPEPLSKEKDHLENEFDFGKLKDASVKNYYSSFPEEEELKALFTNAFVIHRPMDTVGGDGFWVYKEREYVFLVAFDCMGHGRLASMMTRLYIKAIREVVEIRKTYEPVEILIRIHKYMENIYRERKNIQVGSGSDMAVLRLDTRQNRLSYSGVRMDLVQVTKENVRRIKSDKRQIGEYFDVPHSFHSVDIDLNKAGNSRFYLFSDGVTDLFGGPGNKKLGFNNLREILEEASFMEMNLQKLVIERKLDDWQGDQPPLDDLLMIGIAV